MALVVLAGCGGVVGDAPGGPSGGPAGASSASGGASSAETTTSSATPTTTAPPTSAAGGAGGGVGGAGGSVAPPPDVDAGAPDPPAPDASPPDPPAPDAGNPDPPPGEPQFHVTLTDSNGSVDVVCQEDDGKTNAYGTNTTTETTSPMWACGTPQNCADDQFQLRFERVDATHAHGGRCVTADTPRLTGDGTLSARMYVHSNVPTSDGVYTVAIMETPFSKDTELDLFVVNLADDVVKVGKPGESLPLSLSSIVKRWIEVVMTKKGSQCTFVVKRDGQSTIHVGTGPCTPGKVQNHIVVNSRARDGGHSGSSFVDVAWVKWVSAN